MNGDSIPHARPGLLLRARQTAWRYLSRFDEGEVLRWAFRGMLVGTIGVLGMDLWEMHQRDGLANPASPNVPGLTTTFLPPEVETREPADKGIDPREFLTTDEGKLRAPMSFTLGTGGVLSAEGTIDPGASQRLADEIAARGEYVKTVSLNSPGGSVEDAMAMARLLRDKGIGTTVADGALCASSCPLIMAGGEVRSAGAKAAVGVHQFYAVGSQTPGAAQAMSDAQATTARITRFLTELGIDPALWLHALDTPPRELYYFSGDELKKYRLVTG